MTEWCSGNRLAYEAGETGEDPTYTTYVVTMGDDLEEEFENIETAENAYFDLIKELDKVNLEEEVALKERDYFDRNEWEDEFDEKTLLTNY